MKKNYELLDTGKERKLEKFGDVLVNRPAKKAKWRKGFSEEIWKSAGLSFGDGRWNEGASGMLFKAWFADALFELKPLGGGQVGIFPEQEINWVWLSKIATETNRKLNILNGFASTGASTLFCSTENTEVCHVDGSKASVKTAARNAALSRKDENKIRWITDDVVSFMKREVRRGKKYDGFIFDPPAFGRGKGGKEWCLKRDLPFLLETVNQLSRGQPEFVLISSHDPELSSCALGKLLKNLDGVRDEEVESGVLEIPAKSGQNLPGGVYARWRRRTF
ncbi:MAG: hypothetical protein ACE5FU_04560 [Nitrospinota bacterium]